DSGFRRVMHCDHVGYLLVNPDFDDRLSVNGTLNDIYTVRNVRCAEVHHRKNNFVAPLVMSTGQLMSKGLPSGPVRWNFRNKDIHRHDIVEKPDICTGRLINPFADFRLSESEFSEARDL